MTSVADRMFNQSLGLGPDSPPVTEVELNPAMVRFNEVLDMVADIIPKDVNNVYIKMGTRLMRELSKDMSRMPEEQIIWYTKEFGSAMLYIATGRDPREILEHLGVETFPPGG